MGAGPGQSGAAPAGRQRPFASGQFVAELREIHPRHLDWTAGLAYAALNWLADLACLVASCRAVGAHGATIELAVVAYVAGMAVSSVSLLPGGLGVVDAAMVLALVHGGLSPVQATAGVLLYRLISFVFIVASAGCRGLAPGGWTVGASLAAEPAGHRSCNFLGPEGRAVARSAVPGLTSWALSRSLGADSMRVAIVAVSVLAFAGCLTTAACSSSGSGKGSTTSPAAGTSAGSSSSAGATASGSASGASNAALCADIQQVNGTLTTLVGAANDPSALKTAITSAAALLQKLETDAASVPSLTPTIQDLGKQFQAAQAAVNASPPDQRRWPPRPPPWCPMSPS